MRTTIEITDSQRARLLEAAAKRGEKGFSSIVQAALDRYFEDDLDRRERVVRGIEALGRLTDQEADELEQEALRVRRSWR